MSDTSTNVQNQLDAPMPWIGTYISAASLLCTLAMAADAFHGFKTRKFWFPTKYFPLNAASISLLAVAMKLPIDLTTQMCDVTDRLAKLSSLVFMSTAMANFLTSLGSMGNTNILMNIVALTILVITVTVNEIIQIMQLHVYLNSRLLFVEEMLAMCFMLVLLIMICSSALMIPSAKRNMETKYRDMYKDHLERARARTSDELRLLVEKYWVMAETSSPQFLIARSVIGVASGIICILIAIILMEAHIRMAMKYMILDRSDSNYAWSTKWILLTQSCGVMVGTIAPASRWFIAMRIPRKSIRSVLKVEEYWTQKMVEWKQSSLCFEIRHLKSRKVVYDLRGTILQLCIQAQFLIVVAIQLVVLVFSACFNRFIFDSGSSNTHKVVFSEAITSNSKVGIRHYVMLLDGENELPTGTLQNICKDLDEVIQRGKSGKRKDLLKLLRKSSSFRGVKEFDSYQVRGLHSQDFPYCWSLPVVTLKSIVLALPNIEKHKLDSLLKSVSEGLSYVRLIDENLDSKGSLVNIRSAADDVWLNAELYKNWQDIDLLQMSLRGKSSTKTLQELGDSAEKTVLEFNRNARDCLMKNPLDWPGKVIAANAMYRISRTILRMSTHDEEHDKTDEELFEKLSIMIADILTACLTNLARVITVKCHRIAIEKREKSVHRAALLLGETEEILGLLRKLELPVLLDIHQGAAYIEERRAVIKHNTSKKNHGYVSRPITAMKPEKDHVAIQMEE